MLLVTTLFSILGDNLMFIFLLFSSFLLGGRLKFGMTHISYFSNLSWNLLEELPIVY